MAFVVSIGLIVIFRSSNHGAARSISDWRFSIAADICLLEEYTAGHHRFFSVYAEYIHHVRRRGDSPESKTNFLFFHFTKKNRSSERNCYSIILCRIRHESINRFGVGAALKSFRREI